jgi:hypothetical protein
MADKSINTKVQRTAGGDQLTVAAGGKIVHEGQTAVTQATSITTGVTCHALTGVITTVSQTVAAGAEADFVVTNNQVAATDVVVACIKTHTSAGLFMVGVSAVGAGQFTLRLTNLDASVAGNNVLVINFFVIKATA